MGKDMRQNWRSRAWLVLLVLLLIRLAAMVFIPLNDTTEARYAEIARKMLETGDWVTLYQDYGVPFWAKPPLSIWLSAASMAMFGINGFAARLPSLLLCLGVLALVAALARRRTGPDGEMAAMLILGGSLQFLVAAGAVMTDPALMFATTLSLVSFWRALEASGRRWGYLFFVGLGLGLLAKGPLALVLAAMPIGLWVMLRGEWRACWKCLPWLSGTLLMLVIALPWYALAELRTPGFLDYFIMGEHVRRFLEPGWAGDRYGFSHATPLGMIWLYALSALLPWSVAMLFWLTRSRREVMAMWRQDADGWTLYLALWSVMPLAFFTVSRNIIWPYSLPMLPAFALLAAGMWCRASHPGSGRAMPWLALTGGVAVLAATLVFAVRPDVIGASEKRLVEAWSRQADANSQLIYWHGGQIYSAEFYSAGRAHITQDSGRLLSLLDNGSVDFIAVGREYLDILPPRIRENFAEAGRFDNPSGLMILLRERSVPAASQPTRVSP